MKRHALLFTTLLLCLLSSRSVLAAPSISDLSNLATAEQAGTVTCRADPTLAGDTNYAEGYLGFRSSGSGHICRQIVFVDPLLKEHEKLIQDLSFRTPIIILSPNGNGVEEITHILSKHQDLRAVHIVSHGAAGQVMLGKATLSLDSLDDYAEALVSWGASLAPTADILIYGCNVAGDQKGTALVAGLAKLTGADVAASDDATGARQQGGDWNLERRHGPIETDFPFNRHEMTNYPHLLGMDYVDMNNWVRTGPGGADWQVQPGGRTVKQTVNGDPTFYVSGQEHINIAMQGTCMIDTTGDDDFVGIVLGYKAPADTTDSDYEMILFDWKQGAQSGAEEGFALIRVNGIFEGADISTYFWNHADTGPSGKFDVLATDYGIGKGWLDQHEYSFRLVYTESRVKIVVDDVCIFDVSGTFQQGKIGFYNYSQEDVIYGNVKYGPGSIEEVPPVATADSYGMDWNTTLTVDRFGGILANDYDPNLDTFTTHPVSDVSHGTLELNTSDGSFTYTPTSGWQGTDSFTYYLTDDDGDSETVAVEISVMEPNAAPTNIHLSNNRICAGSPNGSVIGALSTTDPNTTDSHDYMLLVNGGGRFGVSGDDVVVANSSLLTAGSYTIEVRSTDLRGLYYDKEFMVHVFSVPPVIMVSSGTSSFVEDLGPINVDPDLTVTDADGGTIDGAKVSISGGYVPGEDSLSFTVQHGISGSFNSTTGVLSLSGDGSAPQYEDVLRSVTYTNISQDPDTGDRTVTFSLGGSTLYCPATEHFYEFVTFSGITWSSAETAAQGRFLYGLQGYLVTVTSEEENAFVAGKLSGQGWMGASDAASESTWRWVTGPEGTEDGGLGRHFFTQSGVGGSAVNGEYHNWASGEPNNWSNIEDHAHFYVDGTWNDYAYDNGSIEGYVVEYGGMSGESTLQLEGSKTVTVGGSDDPPTVANPISDVMVDEDGSNTSIDVTGVFTDVDDNDAAIVKAVQSNSNGGLVSATIIGNTLALDYQDDQNGSATIVIRATSNGKTVDDTFLVTVNAENDAPVVDDQTFAIDENSANTTPVGTVTANDVDGPSLTYDITGGNTNAAFAINPSDGQITVNDSAQLDYETTPSYGLDVEVSDGTLSDTATMTINLNNLIDTYATVTTTAPFNITASAASTGGNVTTGGDSPVTARGICWDTASNPTVDFSSRTTDGSGTGGFSSAMTGLDPNTTYHVRAYATNSMGTSYGEDLTFTTEKTTPTVTTAEPFAITATTAICGGEVTADGGAEVTARGVCWNTAGNPTTADDHTIDGSGMGGFSTTITGLRPNTAYDARAYATNSEGTAYGGAWTFSTKPSSTAPLFMLLLDTQEEQDEGGNPDEGTD